MKKALVYSCVLLLLSCGGKTGGTSRNDNQKCNGQFAYNL